MSLGDFPQAFFHDFFRFRLQAIQTPHVLLTAHVGSVHRASATWCLDFRVHRGFLREASSLLHDTLLVYTLEHAAALDRLARK